MNGRAWRFLGGALLLLLATPVPAQICDDGTTCTVNDLCSEGQCNGTPVGGSCDDGNPCTVNDTCAGGECRGTPGNAGAACNQGCGTCQAGMCIFSLGANGKPCDDSFICTTNDRCQFGICFGDFKFCPDSDGNACTLDFCNPINGACMATDFAPCDECQSCTDVDGEPVCAPTSNGATCDDFNPCTGDGVCSSGECLDGPPVSPGAGTPTPTATETQGARPTATRTATAVPTQTPLPTSTPVPSQTPVPSATPAPATPTSAPATATTAPTQAPTSTPPTVVATATVPPTVAPTATPSSAVCFGDCNGDAEVTVDEVITGVNIALGSVAVANCTNMDANADGEVTVDEILKAINAALNGCP